MAVNSGPIFALILIQGGLRSIGVSALRASIRSIRRPSGATCPGEVERSVVTERAYARANPDPENNGWYATDVTYQPAFTAVSRTGLRG